MKLWKKLSMLVMSLCMLAGIFLVSGVEAEAASIPSKLRLGLVGKVETLNDGINYEWDIPVGCSVKNIKTSSSNLKVKQSGYYYEKEDGKVVTNRVSFKALAKKKGTYKFSFEVHKNGKKVSSKSVTIYAYPDSPIKSVTIGGKSPVNYITKKSGTLKVTMNKGYKIKKIEVGVLKKITRTDKSIGTEYVFKTVKNGAKITLGTVAYYGSYESGSQKELYHYKNWWNYFEAPTQIKITYKDKYTGKTCVAYEYFYRLVM